MPHTQILAHPIGGMGDRRGSLLGQVLGWRLDLTGGAVSWKSRSGAPEGRLTWTFLERTTRFELATLTLAR